MKTTLILSCLMSMSLATSEANAAFPSLDSDGNFNSGFGTLTLQFVSGQFNTASGYEALRSNTSGGANTASGYEALFFNTEGGGNTASGVQALLFNTTGSRNTASGFQALSSSDVADDNTAFGYQALFSSTRGDNTAVGVYALFANTTGTHNVANGGYALRRNTIGVNNTAAGYMALSSNTIGSYNTAFGGAMSSNTIGKFNTAMGYQTLHLNTTGANNTASGANTLYSNKTGSSNTATGVDALHGNTTGSGNIALGRKAGYNLTKGDNNIVIGNVGVADESGTIRIGSTGVHRKTYIAGIKGVSIQSGAAVLINSSGQLGVQTSSRRFKEDIEPMGSASTKLLTLKPVTFRYRDADAHGDKPVQYGLIAEDVAEVMPELVVFDDQGKPETVAYQVLSSLLLNELQKAVQKLNVIESSAALRFEEANALINEQASELTAVKAQLSAQTESLARLYTDAEGGRNEIAALRAELAQIKQITRAFTNVRQAPPGLAIIGPSVPAYRNAEYDASQSGRLTLD